jgi:hypothetical protein
MRPLHLLQVSRRFRLIQAADLPFGGLFHFQQQTPRRAGFGIGCDHGCGRALRVLRPAAHNPAKVQTSRSGNGEAMNSRSRAGKRFGSAVGPKARHHASPAQRAGFPAARGFEGSKPDPKRRWWSTNTGMGRAFSPECPSRQPTQAAGLGWHGMGRWPVRNPASPERKRPKAFSDRIRMSAIGPLRFLL